MVEKSKDHLKNLLAKKPALTALQLKEMNEMLGQLHRDVPEIFDMLSEEVKKSPTLQDLLLIMSADEYMHVVPDEFKVADDAFPGALSFDFKRLPSTTEFAGLAGSMLRNMDVLEREANITGRMDDLEFQLERVSEVFATLPNTMDVIDNINSGKPISREMARDLLEIANNALEFHIEMHMELDDDEVDGSAIEANAASKEASKLSRALSDLIKQVATHPDHAKQFQRQAQALKPDYMSDEGFKEILAAYALIEEKYSKLDFSKTEDTLNWAIFIKDEPKVAVYNIMMQEFKPDGQQYAKNYKELSQFYAHNKREFDAVKGLRQVMLQETQTLIDALGLNIKRQAGLG